MATDKNGKFAFRWGVSFSDILTGGVILSAVVWLNAEQSKDIEGLQNQDTHLKELMDQKHRSIDSTLEQIADDVRYLARKERAE